MNDKTSKGLSVISVICIIYLGLSNYSLKKHDNSLMLDSIMEQVPPEVERISRRVAKEEGIKLFEEFRDNFNKLSEEEK